MKMTRHLLSAAIIACLASCAGMYQKSFNYALATAVIKNNTQGVASNVGPANASTPLNGVPPIYYAASYGNEQMINLLHNNGASLQSRSPQGRSLAYAAASNGHRSTASKLVRLNAGTPADLSSGAAAYERKKAAQAEARRLQAAALTWLAGVMVQSMAGGGGGDGSSENERMMDRYGAAQQAYQRGQGPRP